ncbi:MAG: VWA domain-containing protein [Verrucomicrobiota bacterium]
MWDAFHFIRPAWLLAAPLAGLVWWLHRNSRDPLRGWRKIIAPELLKPLTLGASDDNHWRPFLPLLTWLLAVLALAGPTWKPEPSPFADDPVPLMIVLDAGESMELKDMPPSRIERAHLKIADLADGRKGQPLGLVTYSGSSHLVLPPTRDTAIVAQMAAEITPSIMPKPGDDLANALKLANQQLSDLGGSIVVVSDNISSNQDEALRTYRKESRTPVHFLAIARPDTPELDSLRSAASALDASLTLIAPDSSDIETLVSKTARAPVAVAAAGQGTRWAESGWWLLIPIALLTLVAFRRTQRPTLSANTIS